MLQWTYPHNTTETFIIYVLPGFNEADNACE